MWVAHQVPSGSWNRSLFARWTFFEDDYYRLQIATVCMAGGQTRGDNLQRSHENGWGFLGWTGLAFLHYKGPKTRKGLMGMAAADLSADVEWAAVAVQLLTVLT
jgi:hypothetical protein